MASPQSSPDYPGTGQGPRNRDNPHMRRVESYTPEEMSILRECNRESLFYRCIPLSLAGVGGVQYLAAIGKIRTHPRYGTLFKNLGACFLGYIGGKFMYMETCKQKIMERIPHSRLAKGFGGRGGYTERLENSMPTSPNNPEVQDTPLREQYSSFDLNERPQSKRMSELDDNLRPTMDREIKLEDDLEDKTSPALSYDELRQRNRQEHSKRSQFPAPNDPYNQRPFPHRHPPSTTTPPVSTSLPETQGIGKQKNKYGDSWD